MTRTHAIAGTAHLWTLREYILHYVRWAPYLD